ncbi:hypothetical protein BG005_003833, partial [Podila minutissima]
MIRREAEKQTIALTELQVGFSLATYGPQGVITSDNRKSCDGKHARDDDNGTEKLLGTPMKHVYITSDDYKEISAGQKHPRDDDKEYLVTPTKDAYYIGEDDREIPRTTAPPPAIGSISSYVASSASYRCSTLPPLMPDLAEGFNLE